MIARPGLNIPTSKSVSADPMKPAWLHEERSKLIFLSLNVDIFDPPSELQSDRSRAVPSQPVPSFAALPRTGRLGALDEGFNTISYSLVKRYLSALRSVNDDVGTLSQYKLDYRLFVIH